MKITVAIPYYNRNHMICETLHNLLHHPLVDEIVIQDDCSTEDDFRRLNVNITNLKKAVGYSGDKVKIYRNKKNIGSFLNKIEVVKNSTGDSVILLDSDNILFENYFEAIRIYNSYPFRVHDWLLCPQYACPNLDYSIFKDEIFRKANARHFLNEPFFSAFMNTGNFFFKREAFIRKMQCEEENFINPSASCSIYIFYIWLKHGGLANIMEGASYYHRIHDDSLWMQNQQPAQAVSKKLIEEMRTW